VRGRLLGEFGRWRRSGGARSDRNPHGRDREPDGALDTTSTLRLGARGEGAPVGLLVTGSYLRLRARARPCQVIREGRSRPLRPLLTTIGRATSPSSRSLSSARSSEFLRAGAEQVAQETSTSPRSSLFAVHAAVDGVYLDGARSCSWACSSRRALVAAARAGAAFTGPRHLARAFELAAPGDAQENVSLRLRRQLLGVAPSTTNRQPPRSPDVAVAPEATVAVGTTGSGSTARSTTAASPVRCTRTRRPDGSCRRLDDHGSSSATYIGRPTARSRAAKGRLAEKVARSGRRSRSSPRT
jgi:hypothetical protein